MNTHVSLDAVGTRILWDRLVSIVDEAAMGLVRTSHSMVVRDFHDYCVGIFDAHGTMLAHSTKTTPGFIGMMPFVMQHFLESAAGSDLAPGDVLATNDPWKATGHNNDITLAAPVFLGGTLIGFTACVVHHLDIGGRMASLESLDMYEEGLKIPILKLYSRGVRNETMFALLRENVRMADKVLGDIDAQLAAMTLCERGIVRMIDQYGFSDLSALSDAITTLSRQSMERKILELPDGIYRKEALVPPPGRLTEPLRIAVSVEVKGSQIAIDYAGSSPAVEAAVNVTLPFTTSYSSFPIKAALDAEVPNNAGGLAPISVTAPEGSLLNCRPPSPTYGRTYIAHLLPEIVLGALAPALSERIIASCGSTPLVALYFAGQNVGGERFLSIISHMGGYGAGAGQDGHSTLAFPGNTASIPVEVTERDTPLLYLKKELLPDSAGPGLHRGGFGQEIEITLAEGRAEGDRITASLRGANRSPDGPFPVQGRNGGGPGRGAGTDLNGTPTIHGVPYTLRPGDRLTIRLPGGGGFGNPMDRPVEAVRADAAASLLSPEMAAIDYGVLLTPEGAVDAAATAVRRKETEVIS